VNITELNRLPAQEVETSCARIPFFRELRHNSPAQWETLLHACCVVQLAPGEVIMRRGQQGSWVYFLLKGNLLVYRDEPQGKELAEITPGELFGDLALVGDSARKATVAAPASRGATVLACDLRTFGVLADFSRVSLPTKLGFYRTVLHSIRWRLERYRAAAPAHPLVSELLKAPAFAGERGAPAELEYLVAQARLMAQLLERWNDSGSPALELAPA
jgi:CRP/FNR family cyclic AMP-dependent transcriptional regulator